MRDRGDFTQEVDLVHGICGAHGGYKTTEVRDVRRIIAWRGLRGGPGKRVDGVLLVLAYEVIWLSTSKEADTGRY